MRFVTWMVVLAGIGIAGYLLVQTQELTVFEKKKRQELEQPILIKGMDLYEYNHNKLSWRFQIKGAELYEKREQTYVTTLSGQIFPDPGESEPIEVRAMNGVIDNALNQITLKNRVHISFPEGGRVDTEYLVIDLRNKKIFNNHQVVLNSQKGKIIGSSMEYDIKSGNLKLKQIEMNIAFD